MPRKGYKHTLETRARISAAMRGRAKSPEARVKMSIAHRGKHPSSETRARMSEAMRGNKRALGHRHTAETRAKMSVAHMGMPRSDDTRAKIGESKRGNKYMLGRILSPETRAKISAANRGANHPQWRGGRSREPYTPEFDVELKEAVRAQCDYRCQICGKPQVDCNLALAVHHIDYDKTNSELENLVALCQSCHMRTNHNRETWTAVFLGRKQACLRLDLLQPDIFYQTLQPN